MFQQDCRAFPVVRFVFVTLAVVLCAVAVRSGRFELPPASPDAVSCDARVPSEAEGRRRGRGIGHMTPVLHQHLGRTQF